jgi:hypothetical protein
MSGESPRLETATKRKPGPTAEPVAAEELLRRARERRLSLTGPHLGHERNTAAGNVTVLVLEGPVDGEPRRWIAAAPPSVEGVEMG